MDWNAIATLCAAAMIAGSILWAQRDRHISINSDIYFGRKRSTFNDEIENLKKSQEECFKEINKKFDDIDFMHK